MSCLKPSHIIEFDIRLMKKKLYGVFYTDIKLSLAILKFLNLPKQASILDPCCGRGSFIKSAILCGFNKVYGVDIDKAAVDFCNDNYLQSIVIRADTLSNSGTTILNQLGVSQKMDCIIGNPPYGKWNNTNLADKNFRLQVKRNGNDMFIAALLRAFEMIKNNGKIAYILPKNLLHVAKYKVFRKYLLANFSIKAIIDIGIYFKEVRGEQIILILQKTPPLGNFISLETLEGDEFQHNISIPQNFYEDKIILFKNQLDKDIYQALNKQAKLGTLIKNIHRGKYTSEDAIKGKNIQKFRIKNIQPQLFGNQIFIQNIYSVESGIIGSYAGNLKASQTVTVLTDGDKFTCHYILFLLHSKIANFYLFKYCYNSSHLTVHADSSYIKDIPLPTFNSAKKLRILKICSDLEKKIYMSNEWLQSLYDLNELAMSMYNLDIRMKNYINETMNCIMSDKWSIEHDC